MHSKISSLCLLEYKKTVHIFVCAKVVKIELCTCPLNNHFIKNLQLSLLKDVTL